MRRSLFALPLAVIALAPVAGCGEAAPPPKPTAAEIKELRATADVSAPAGPGFTMPTFQMPGMAHRAWTVKETAVDALARIGNMAVPALIDALNDPNPDVRVEAARSLARMGDQGKAAVPTLIERLSDPNEEVRQASARALGQMGPAAAEAVPALMALIKAPDAESQPADHRKSPPQKMAHP
ncbi:MAG TPA: HEAT repeat domain-containing protein [Pirellulales bacterium]|jgi:hypothetical protein